MDCWIESVARFVQQRHKQPTDRARECELVIVCPSLRSRVNLSRVIRVAGCFGVRRVIACRPFTIDPAIARAAIEYVKVESRGAMLPVLKKLKQESYRLVGLEQTTESISLYQFRFPSKTALVLGHERSGIEASCLEFVDDVAEIPVFGQPLSYNVATAAAMAIYEYGRQHIVDE